MSVDENLMCSFQILKPADNKPISQNRNKVYFSIFIIL